MVVWMLALTLAAEPAGGASEALLGFARLAEALTPEVAAAWSAAGASLRSADLETVARRVGLDLSAWPGDAEAILAEPRPVLCRLVGPDAWVVVLLADERHAIVAVDPGGRAAMLPREEFGRRYRPPGFVIPRDVPAAAPRLVVEPVHRDLGLVRQGVEVTTALGLRNAGETDLKVVVMNGSCSLTACVRAAGASHLTVPAGAAVSLDVTFEARRTGALVEPLWLLTNDPLRPRVAVSLGATVTPGWRAQPDSVRLQSPKAGGGKTEIRLVGPLGGAVDRLTCDPPIAEVAVERTTDGESTRDITIGITALGGPAGDHAATIVLHTTDPDVPEVRVPLLLRRPSDLDWRQRRIDLPDGSTALEIELTDQFGGELQVEVECDQPRLRVWVIQHEDPSRRLIYVARHPGDTAVAAGRLRLVTTVLDEPPLEIPVVVLAD